MKFLIGTLLLGLAVAIPPFDRAPTITLNQNRDAEGGIPSISIAFPDGYADNMILNKVDEEEMEENECIFMGHLETETSACIAMTGCPGIDNVELTIFSKHAERSGVMKWSKDGSVELVDRAKLDVPRPERLETPREDDDWEVDGDVEFKQADVDSMLDIEEGCPNGTCADKIQRTHVLTYKLFFDDKFLAKHKTIKEARKQLRATIAHTQVHYCHASLGSKIKLKKSGEYSHLSGEVWPAQFKALKRCGKLTEQKLGKADIAIFFGHDESKEGKFGGVAYQGVACKNGSKKYRCQLNLWWFNPSTTASVVAHEIGHNIGMEHDHYPPHKNNGCDKTGIMSYGEPPMQWSACSKADFEAHYLQYRKQWCMEEDEDACKTA
eukprot:11434.XXX_259963_261725_1 [CDS] Oithona nana genome sequencing.